MALSIPSRRDSKASILLLPLVFCFEVGDETPECQAGVQMEVQAKVDGNYPDEMVDTIDERIYGTTIEQE